MTTDEPLPDMGALLSQLGQMRQSIQDAQQEAAHAEVEGSAGGGMVRVRVAGSLDFKSVHIDPSVIDPTDVSLVEDLVLSAIRDAVIKVNDLQRKALGAFTPPGGLEGLFGA